MQTIKSTNAPVERSGEVPVHGEAPAAPASTTAVMQAGPTVAADSAVAPTRGPASPAYLRDLANLAQLINAPKIDHAAIAAAATKMMTDHDVAESIGHIVRIHHALLPVETYGLTDKGEHQHYGIDGIIEGTHDPIAYYERLAELVPAVQAGEMTADDARRKAARPFWSKIGGFFSTGKNEDEIANVSEQRGIVFRRTEEGALAFTTQATFKPSYHDISKRAWTDLASSIVIDGKGGVSVDPFEPKASYTTLMNGLRYIGDVARFLVATNK